MDSLLFWNIRGLNEPSKQHAIKKIQKDNKCSLVCILETRVREKNKVHVLAGLKLGHWEAISNYEFSSKGRIWFLWDSQKFSVQILEKAEQFIHCKVTSIISQEIFLVTALYALNEAIDRVCLWQALRRIATSISLPWIVSGDFNTILWQVERLKNGSIFYNNRNKLQQLVQDTQLRELRFSGYFFTWSNKHTDNTRMVCKLDRALVNDLWMSAFDNSEAVFLNPATSDHSACLINFNTTTARRKHVFRFCNMWCFDDRFEQLV